MPLLCLLNIYSYEKYEQSVEINFMFPDGTSKPHPALIVSNNDLQEAEGFIYLCKYCYVLNDEMLTVPMAKNRKVI